MEWINDEEKKIFDIFQQNEEKISHIQEVTFNG
jgi:hypothetical protein